MKTLSLTEVKAKLSELVDEVESRDERIVITRKGRPAAVLVSQDDLDSWQETLEITSDRALMTELRRGIRQIKRGQTVSYEEVFFSVEAAAAVKRTHPDQRRKIRAMIDALSDRPDLGKALRRELDGFWSARVGRQRVIYQWSRGRLDVVLVGPRATIYEEASRLRSRGR